VSRFPFFFFGGAASDGFVRTRRSGPERLLYYFIIFFFSYQSFFRDLRHEKTDPGRNSGTAARGPRDGLCVFGFLRAPFFAVFRAFIFTF